MPSHTTFEKILTFFPIWKLNTKDTLIENAKGVFVFVTIFVMIIGLILETKSAQGLLFFFFTKKFFVSSYFLNFDRIIVVVGIVILNNHKRRHREIIIHSALISEIRKYDPEYPKSGYMTVIRIHSPLTQSWANRCLKFRLNSSRCSLTSCKYCWISSCGISFSPSSSESSLDTSWSKMEANFKTEIGSFFPILGLARSETSCWHKAMAAFFSSFSTINWPGKNNKML